MRKIVVLTSTILIFISSCKKELFIQDKRTFYMGVTPWPPDFSPIGQQKAYDFINSQCDMFVNHMGEGVPWEEALNGTEYNSSIIENINDRINANKGRIVYLELSVLTDERTKKARYWGPPPNESIKTKWENLGFDDTLVSNAYFNYCCFMVDKFQPTFLNYAVESNSKHWTDVEFNKYLVFLSRVYSRLKNKYPTLPVFVSYMVSTDNKQYENAKKLNLYSDYIALSNYPYLELGSLVYGSTEPVNIPKNWYSKYREIDISKPFAIAETGYIAEDLDLSEYGITKKGDPKWQADYLQMLFEVCNNYNAKFVNYFCSYDYDNAYNTMIAAGVASPAAKTWKDIGFYDGQGIERPSLKVWKKWNKAEIVK